MTESVPASPFVLKGAEAGSWFRRDSMNSGNQTIPQRDVLTLREVAAILRCSKTHVSNVVNGKIEGIPTLTHVRMGRRIMIRSSWLHDWMEANKTGASI